MRWGLTVIALAGCNSVFDLDETELDTRPDRDADRIPDEEDDCIASMDDLTFDSDGDGIANGDDSCALLYNVGVDSDLDGVDDACDPFPTVAGDRRRCANAFRDRALTVSFFESRRPEEFAVGRGFIIGPQGADAVAALPLFSDAGTSMFDAISSSVADNQSYNIALLVSAGEAPGPTDLACVVVASQTSTAIVLQGGTQRFASPPDVPRGNNPIYVRAIFQPGKVGDNVLCGASYGDTTIGASGHYDGPIQRQGFWVPGGGGVIVGYTITERDDQPILF